MKKLFIVLLTVILFATQSHSQTNQQADSTAKAQVEINKFVDSLVTHTTLKDFQLWLYENVSQKNAAEGKFPELYNLFLQQQYQSWIQRKTKPKNK